MAAIIQPHRLPNARPARPKLVLLPGGQASPNTRPAGLVPAIVFAIVLLVATVGAVAIGRGALAGLAPAPATAPAAASAGSAAGGATTVVVHAGDTMWSIARRLQPAGDVRALVDRLVAANGSTAIQPGDRIALPR